MVNNAEQNPVSSQYSIFSISCHSLFFEGIIFFLQGYESNTRGIRQGSTYRRYLIPLNSSASVTGLNLPNWCKCHF